MKKTKAPTTKEIAQTLGVAGHNAIEQAKKAAEKFKTGQVVWFVAAPDLWDRVEIISLNATGRYQGRVLDTSYPVLLDQEKPRLGSIGNYHPDYLHEEPPV